VLQSPADNRFELFLKAQVMPAMIRSDGKIHAPPSFIYQNREYTLKWVGPMIISTKTSPEVRDMKTEHRQIQHIDEYGESNENIPVRRSKFVIAQVPPLWIKDADLIWNQLIHDTLTKRAELTKLTGNPTNTSNDVSNLSATE
jgi:hypothetical protein